MMKKIFAITIVLLLFTVTMAVATETAWRINIKADNGSGSYYGLYDQIGVATNGTDGVDGQDTPCGWTGDLPETNAHVVSVIPADAVKTYVKDIQQGVPATYPNTWDVRVGAAKNAAYTMMRVYFTTVGTTVMPPTGGGLAFKLKMVNNRGVEGAPVNGTEWVVPIPTAHSSTNPFFSLNLPVLKISALSDSAMKAEGYQFEFQQIVPEPGSLLVLGMGIAGLAGFMTRRRRG